MTRATASAVAAALAVAVAACGGSARHITTAPTTAPAHPTSGPRPTATQAPAPQPSGGATPAPPEAHAEVPALYTVGTGGALVPSTISVPAAVPAQLTVVSRDGRAHTVVLRSPVSHTLKVPAGGRASVLITGLRPGTYPLELDGTARGALTIGAQPGP